MSIWTTIENEFTTTETWVLSFIVKLQAGVEMAITDFQAFWSWIGAHAGDITSGVQMVTTAVNEIQAAGLPVPPAATTAIEAMNVAVQGLDAAVAASNAGQSSVQVALAGYTAAKQAASSVQTALGAVATGPVK